MKAAIYLRKSRAEAGDEDALGRHRETLLRFAEHNQIVVEEIYEEIVSGENLYLRPQMLRLLDDISQKRYDAVLCMDIDRLGRGDMASQGMILDTLRTAECLIVTPRRVYDLNNEMDETYSEFEAFMARQEYKMITRRMRRGVTAAAKEGSHISEVPFGYRRAWEGKRASLEPHPENAPWVRRAFDLYVNQFQGCQAIADLFNREGPPPKKAQQWGRTAIRRILRNPIYTGQWVYNRTQWQKRRSLTDKNVALPRPKEDWIVVPNMHEPIVSRELFDEAQEKLKTRKKVCAGPSDLPHLFSGLFFCEACGSSMHLGYTQKRKYIYYSCARSTAIGSIACSTHYINYNTLYQVVQEDIKRNAILFSEDREQATKRLMELKCADEQKQVSKMQGELASAEKRLAELDVKLKRTYEDVCCKG